MPIEIFDLIIIGGGAAGFFGGIVAAEKDPSLRILILEKSGKILSKVRVSGGGRCNVTHHCFNPFRLADHYPRGDKPLKELFKNFQAADMVEWLEKKGVALKAEDDGRMFPVTDDSQTVIDCFLREAADNGIKTKLDSEVVSIVPENAYFKITCRRGDVYFARKLLVAVGGSPKSESYGFLQSLGHTIQKPIPSLFTFNDSKKEFAELMGIAVSAGEVSIAGTRLSQKGPILITHWGLSGPAVIKLSAWAAKYLHEKNYEFTALVNWTPESNEGAIMAKMAAAKTERPKQKIFRYCPFQLPTRLWEKLCTLSGIENEKTWGEISNRSLNRLLENVFRCSFIIKGKTTFKDEFVTCGGIDLADVNIRTMESKKTPNLYFAGEVLDIDGETGGFNFQAAWTTAFVAATDIVRKTPAGRIGGSLAD
jgi:predicted Rossmann fold flavoprotein